LRLPQVVNPRVVKGGDAGAPSIGEKECGGACGGLPESFGQLVNRCRGEPGHQHASLTQGNQGLCSACRDRGGGAPKDGRLESAVQFGRQCREAIPGWARCNIPSVSRRTGTHVANLATWCSSAPELRQMTRAKRRQLTSSRWMECTVRGLTSTPFGPLDSLSRGPRLRTVPRSEAVLAGEMADEAGVATTRRQARKQPYQPKATFLLASNGDGNDRCSGGEDHGRYQGISPSCACLLPANPAGMPDPATPRRGLPPRDLRAIARHRDYCPARLPSKGLTHGTSRSRHPDARFDGELRS